MLFYEFLQPCAYYFSWSSKTDRMIRANYVVDVTVYYLSRENEHFQHINKEWDKAFNDFKKHKTKETSSTFEDLRNKHKIFF